MRRASITNFRYFQSKETDRLWGLTVNTIGVSRIAPGARYPPADHPGAYKLDWTLGRILDEYQIVYISEGEGLLDSRATTVEIGAGDVFVLQPGEWHRYRPSIKTGWQEHWVGLDGPWIRHIMKEAFPQQSLLKVRPSDEKPMADTFDYLQRLSDSSTPGLQQVLAGYTMSLVGLLYSATRPAQKNRNDDVGSIQKAVAALTGPKADEVDLVQLATELNMSYSRFRSAFAKRVGLSPHQFRLHAKLVTARDLLRGSTLSVKEICDRTGFSSEQYFCRIFREHVGCTPGHFRRKGTFEMKHM